MGRKVSSNATSNKDVSQVHSGDVSDIFLEIFGPAEITQDQNEELKYEVGFNHFYIKSIFDS